MKKFLGEFKKFITRGNVVDMAVGVIVGGAFTGIVNGLSNYILKPIINALLALVLGSKGLTGAVTFLSKATTLDANNNEVVDLANSIYIDWGAFVSAIINFLLIAFTLFTIVKIINKVKESNDKLSESFKKGKLTRAQKKELKQAGIKLKDKQAVVEYFANKQAEENLKKEKEALELEEKAKQERLLNPTVEDLLKDIKELLAKSRG